ncbi:MAG: aldehyde dehydrogenase family protein [Deltaproteobacteria bacterium]|nr:aldehyde dehydrogenase family protein [Deltaproteobacteria bacterium]
MEGVEERLEKVYQLIDAIAAHRDEMIATAILDTGFTRRECTIEVDMVLTNLKGFEEMATVFAGRAPLCDKDQEVALLLPYNGSAWLNTAIVSIYMVGNRVRVKFASRGSQIARLTENIYKNIFGDFIRFDYDEGRNFLEKAVSDPGVPAICLFGTDEYAIRYLDAIKLRQKKFVFEGPGKDPFIVLPGADLEDAARELAHSKYIYAGQTCTAPERVYLDASIHDDFLNIFMEFSRAVRVGDPEDPETEMGPVASPRAIAAIKTQLADAVALGGKIVLGGKIEGSLVYPTVVVDANQDMRGMRDEIFGPVVFISAFDTLEEAMRLARDNRYGLRAAIYGGDEEGERLRAALVGEPYCHRVSEMTFGRFGTTAVNEPRSESWVGAFVSKAVGGYGYSGWIWETIDDRFILKQGPKLLSIETSTEIAG